MRERVSVHQLAAAVIRFLEDTGLLKDETPEAQKKLVRVFTLGYRAAEQDFLGPAAAPTSGNDNR